MPVRVVPPEMLERTEILESVTGEKGERVGDSFSEGFGSQRHDDVATPNELSHAGPKDVDREAELNASSRVGCSDLSGVIICSIPTL